MKKELSKDWQDTFRIIRANRLKQRIEEEANRALINAAAHGIDITQPRKPKQ